MKIYKIAQEAERQTLSYWDEEAIHVMATYCHITGQLPRDLATILKSGFHLKFYPQQIGIEKKSLIIYNQAKDMAIKVFTIVDVWNFMTEIEAFMESKGIVSDRHDVTFGDRSCPSCGEKTVL